MRHRKAGRKFDTNAPHRKAMFRNMVTALMVHGQIKTTTQRAKELRRVADKVITLGKRAPTPSDIDGLSGDAAQQARADRVTAIRRAKQWVNDADALNKVFGEYADRFRTRPGGYTRIIKAGFRAGDNADMAIIELVEALDLEAQAAKAEAAETAAADEEATVAMDMPSDDAPAEAAIVEDAEEAADEE
jgi:large subunit ribosomal protein L17